MSEVRESSSVKTSEGQVELASVPEVVSDGRESDPLPSPWEGDILPMNYHRKRTQAGEGSNVQCTNPAKRQGNNTILLVEVLLHARAQPQKTRFPFSRE